MLPRQFTRLTKQAARVAPRAAAAQLPALVLTLPRPTLSTPGSCPRRYLATPPPQLTTNAELSPEQYHAYSNETMECLLDSLEAILDEVADPNYEVEYNSGVLTLSLGDNGTYVINKQPPNMQIWLSSPISGPKRYDYVTREKKWIYAREQQPLGQLLNSELSKILKQDVDLGVDHPPSN